jgi:hypothetical protein
MCLVDGSHLCRKAWKNVLTVTFAQFLTCRIQIRFVAAREYSVTDDRSAEIRRAFFCLHVVVLSTKVSLSFIAWKPEQDETVAESVFRGWHEIRSDLLYVLPREVQNATTNRNGAFLTRQGRIWDREK